MPSLNNDKPIDPLDEANAVWLKNLQGNILNGHGRDHTAHLFLRLPDDIGCAKAVVRELADHVTSAHKQERERQQYKVFRIPGRLFANLFLSASGYRKLGFDSDVLEAAFREEPDEPRPTASNFLEGMAKHAEADLGDVPPATWDKGFESGDIDAMLLLADDDENHLAREARRLVDDLETRCEVARIERGTALRNDDGEGIEHFGYIDGRSQPLYLTADFEGLENGTIGPETTEQGGRVDKWNPFEPLKRVLIPDPLGPDGDCLGSYFVFRKLEQNVRNFTIEEQRLADKLGLEGEDRERAGAMTVGRFRNGAPLALSRTDGFAPPQENNFRFDQDDRDALKCPFQAHIRKTNPRGDIIEQLGGDEAAERRRRITRRGIPYGKRDRKPNVFQALDDLPSAGVGLLFMCFQASIRAQFAFMQRGWANNQDFVKDTTGIDPIIGQQDRDDPNQPPVELIDHTWRPKYGVAEPEQPFFFGKFVTMKGGEFFFAPSIPFLHALGNAG